jgi:hypothetical protein
MKVVSYYDEATGLFNGTTLTASNEQAFLHNTPAGHAAIEGQYDYLSQRVDVTQSPPAIVDYVPPQPSAEHEWNATARRWRLTAQAQAQADARKRALAEIARMEARQPRLLRELFAGAPSLSDSARRALEDIERQVVELRREL